MISLLEYYNKSKRDNKLHKEEYLKRYNNGIKTPFKMTIADEKNKNYTFYFNHPQEYNDIITQINNKSKEIKSKEKYNKYFGYFELNETIKNEIIKTNEIEGVHASRQNIEEVLKDTLPEDKRIDEYKLIKYYQKIINKDITFKNINEVSNVYKDLLNDITDEKDKLTNNNLFRTDTVGVYNGEKLLHEGVSFNSLEDAMSKLLNFMEDDNYIDDFIKVAIFHYYFGYLHPFFDGNGRMNRYMSVYYLEKRIGINALLISNKLMNNRDEYYRIFEETNDRHNMGDLNKFIYTFLNYIKEILEEYFIKIEKNDKKFDQIYEKLKKDKLKDNKFKILLFLIRCYIIAEDSYLIKKELIEILNISEATVRRVLNEFEEKEYVIKGKIGLEFTYKLNVENSYIKEIINE